MLTYPWKCTVLHCNHLGNIWKPLLLMTRHFDYCPSSARAIIKVSGHQQQWFPDVSASSGNNQSVGSSAAVVSRCFPGGYNVKLYISRGRLAWWLLAFLHSDVSTLRACAHLFSFNHVNGIKFMKLQLNCDVTIVPIYQVLANTIMYHMPICRSKYHMYVRLLMYTDIYLVLK